MGLFDKKPGRPSNNEKIIKSITEGAVDWAAKQHPLPSSIDNRLKENTGKGLGDRSGSLVRNISSRLK